MISSFKVVFFLFFLIHAHTRSFSLTCRSEYFALPKISYINSCCFHLQLWPSAYFNFQYVQAALSLLSGHGFCTSALIIVITWGTIFTFLNCSPKIGSWVETACPTQLPLLPGEGGRGSGSTETLQKRLFSWCWGPKCS